MYDCGDAGVVDKALAISLRNNALAKGSEGAAMVFARNRISGYNADAEPEKVLEEIKQRIATEEDFYPEWYEILAFAYQQIGDKENAKKMYRKAVDNKVITSYIHFAMLYQEEGDDANYRKWMLEGIDQGNGLCHILDADMAEEDFQALPESERNRLHLDVAIRLAVGVYWCEGMCAYYQACNYLGGTLGFEQDFEAAAKAANKGYSLGDPFSCALLADMSEENDEAFECFKLDDVQRAFMRLQALRYGDESQLEAVVDAYNKGLYPEESIQEEIRREWLPKYTKPQPKLVKDEMDPC